MASAEHIKGTDKITINATNSLSRHRDLCIQNDEGHFGKQSVQRKWQLTVFGII